MAVTVIIAMALAAAAIAAASFTSETRASVQARAEAEASIDRAWVAMLSYNFCGAQTLVGITEIEYFNAAGTEINCGAVSSAGPVTATVTALGTAANAGVAGNDRGDERTISALFDIEVHPGSVNLDEVIFSDAGVEITNDTQVVDGLATNSANIYSNGDVDCHTQIAIQGWIIAQGDFDAPNRCNVAKSVWAGGTATLSSQVTVSGDVLVAGASPSGSSVTVSNNSWVGGTIIANGTISINGQATSTCSLSGLQAKVCGSAISIEGDVKLNGDALVGGSALAHGDVDLGSTINGKKTVGGDVIATTGKVTAGNVGDGTNPIVGGFLAAGGKSDLPKNRTGNPASSCAAATAGYTRCNPAQPPIVIQAPPTVLNWPTNTRVVAPPRESLPEINSDALSLTKWAGYAQVSVACADVKASINSAWSGKRLMFVTGCTDPLDLGAANLTLPGDLVLFVPSGIAANNNPTFRSSVPGTVRELMMIVPSDARLSNGTTRLMNWTTPVPGYQKPVCVNGRGQYGNMSFSNLTLVDTRTFLYTPCDLSLSNGVTGFVGQIYVGGTAQFPNNSTITFRRLNVLGAVQDGAAPFVEADQTARFDVRD